MFWRVGCLAALVLVLIEVSSGEKFSKGKLFFEQGERNFGEAGDNVQTYWFDQLLDHGNPSDTRTWKQRYFINDTFYKPGGPVFLQIGGEGEANPIWMTHGSWIEYAEKLGAFCIQLEHRFYGKSHPLPDLSVKNLQYLTSEQALGDLANFVATMKATNFTENNKWVTFGGSYPGSLAAWFRLKYPHLVDISVSSSAPLVAQLDFKEYLGVVDSALNVTNPQCHEEIQEAVKTTEMLLRRRVGWQMIKKAFNLCDDFMGNADLDVANLFETLAGNFMDIVQYNKDNRGFEGSKTANISIDTLCDIMTNDTKLSAFQRYAKVNQLLLNATEQKCTDFKYRTYIKRAQDPSWTGSAASGERQWMFQTCTEFGFYQTSDLDTSPFGTRFPLDFSVRQCGDIYGSKYSRDFIERGIFRTNANYGGKNLSVTRVIFVNGSIDPWHALGITKQEETTKDNLVIFIEGTAHCANMYPSSSDDSKELEDAREAIFQQISTWLNE